ncbi:MAG: hypothetical protein M2R45_00346 [Verrucomicrobia subdivision 3 bacterium]|nr:hypothetical protein [Limisphaerales bacterium]MCS1412896.1 hypothetical protein [Limisphaerales bacterium]
MPRNLAPSFWRTDSRSPDDGAWLNYGLGSMTENLPPYVAVTSVTKTPAGRYSMISIGARAFSHLTIRRQIS